MHAKDYKKQVPNNNRVLPKVTTQNIHQQSTVAEEKKNIIEISSYMRGHNMRWCSWVSQFVCMHKRKDPMQIHQRQKGN